MRSARDGLSYVRLDPGTFVMGCVPGDSSCTPEERPARRVSIGKPIWISRTEVTVDAFSRFVAATGYQTEAERTGRGRFWQTDQGWDWVQGLTWRRPFPNVPADPQWPAVQVSWADSDAFCRWSGGRLPTEAEWEYAARGGRNRERFPWGNNPTPLVAGKIQANGPDERTLGRFPLWEIFTGFDDGYEMLAPVGRFAPNGFGLFDIAGNAWEWVGDWYAPDAYAKLPAVDPHGPENSAGHVARGGSWGYAPRQLRSSERGWAEPGFWTATFGFRCIRDEAPPPA
jgi:formylglycine-generating enzyme required for sulfatase activity